jgi:hypothetical protein
VKRGVAAAVAATAALALAAAAGARAPTISIGVTPKVVHRGHTVVVSGTAGSCPVGDAVTIISHAFPAAHEFAGVPAVFARVHAGDHFRITVRIPKKHKTGAYTITARCGGGNLGVSAKLTVKA